MNALKWLFKKIWTLCKNVDAKFVGWLQSKGMKKEIVATLKWTLRLALLAILAVGAVYFAYAFFIVSVIVTVLLFLVTLIIGPKNIMQYMIVKKAVKDGINSR